MPPISYVITQDEESNYGNCWLRYFRGFINRHSYFANIHNDMFVCELRIYSKEKFSFVVKITVVSFVDKFMPN